MVKIVERKQIDIESFKVFFNEIIPSFDSFIYTALDELHNEFSDSEFEIIQHSLINNTHDEAMKWLNKILNFEIEYLFLNTENAQVTYENLISDIYEKYADFFSFLKIHLENNITSVLEFLKRYINDRDKIKEFLNENLEHPLELINLSLNLGDYHNNSRSPAIITFSNHKKIVYKPRNAETDIIFNNGIKFMNKFSNNEIESIKLIPNQKYTWYKFVDYIGTDKEFEHKKFYYNSGMQLCLLYILGVTDIHYENIIACKNMPFIIDLESMFIASINNSKYTALKESVLMTDFLPYNTAKTKNLRESSMQGISNIKFIKNDSKFKNHPFLFNFDGSVIDYVSDIKNGFRDAYEVILNNICGFKKEIFDGIEQKEFYSRVILRNTSTYFKLLNGISHPILAYSSKKRKEYLEELSKFNPLITNQNIISYEMQCLNKFNIPIFYKNYNSRDLITGDGFVINEFFQRSGREIFNDKLERLSTEDLAKQLYIIDTTIKLNNINYSDYALDLNKLNYEYQIDEIREEISKDEILKSVYKIADKLLSLSFDNKEWLSIKLNINKIWYINKIDYDLYDGKLGLLLFFGYLTKISNEPKYTNQFNLLLSECDEYYNSNLKANSNLFAGYSGYLYVMLKLKELFPSKISINMKKISKMIIKNKKHLSSIEILNGITGVALIFLRAFEMTKDRYYLKLSLDTISDVDWGFLESPHTFIEFCNKNEFDLSFAHGLSGIKYYFNELYKYTKKPKLIISQINKLEIDKDILSYFNNSNDNHSWCHGSLGINLVDISVGHNIDSHTFEGILALDDYSLCHGRISLIEYLLLNSNNKNLNFNKEVKKILFNISMDNFKCGTPESIDTPGLMTGISGIGYELLRLVYPKIVPNILLLK